VKKTSYVVIGPKVIKNPFVKSFNTASGKTVMTVTFDQSVQYALVPRPAAVESKNWLYEQANTGLVFATGVAQNLSVATDGADLTLTFFVELPARGPPTHLVYSILSDFLRSAVMALPSTVASSPHWPYIAPLPAKQFSVDVDQPSDMVVTSVGGTNAPMLMDVHVPTAAKGDFDDVLALQLNKPL
jgi:hypothetical protein